MPKIQTLVQDINNLLEGKSPLDLPPELAEEFAENMKVMVQTRIGQGERPRPTLRMSNLGKPCRRQVYLNIHEYEKAEDLRAETYLKFLYGDVIEELILFLAKAAGHEVTGEQDRMELEGVVGHRDAIIDGMLVDVKSASSYSFVKFRDGKLHEEGNDPFGYRGQIQSYLEASQDDPLVTIKDKCAFLVMDKTLGHVVLDIHDKVKFDVRKHTRSIIEQMDGGTTPDRAFKPVPDGKAGNMKLGMQCSYCNMKHACHPNVRTFIYSNGPRYLTKVVRVPDVVEV